MAINTARHMQTNTALALKAETTEGTFATPTLPGDAARFMYDAMVEQEDEELERPAVTLGNLTQPQTAVGNRIATLTGRFEVKGHGEGAGNDDDATEWDPIMMATGCRVGPAKTLDTVSAAGTFLHGEKITGASTGIGYVYKNQASGTTLRALIEEDFATTSDTITGAVSGATATTENPASETVDGRLYMPTDEVTFTSETFTDATVFTAAPGTISADWYMIEKDGNQVRTRASGFRGNVIISLDQAGHYLIGECNLQGQTDPTAPFADTTESDFPASFDPGLPQRFQGTNIVTFHDVNFTASDFRFDTGNQMEPRYDHNNGGLNSFYVASRAPTFTFSPEVSRVVTFDWDNIIANGTLNDMSWNIGTESAGTRVEFYAPDVQIISRKPTNRGLIRTWEITARCTFSRTQNVPGAAWALLTS